MHTVQDPGRVASGVLALTVHVVFFTLLVFGVNWQKKITVPVMVDLWEELPELEPKPAVVVPPPPPKPAPEVKKAPPPEIKKAPPPAPIKQVAPPKPAAAEIELKEKQRLQKEEEQARQLEERRQAEAEKRRLDEEKRLLDEEKHREEEEKRNAEDSKRRADAELKHLQQEREREAAELARQAEQKKLEEQRRAEELKREQERKERAAVMERERVQQEALRKQREAEDAKKRAEAAQLAAHKKLIETYMAQIRAKVLPRIRVPDDMKGNPEGVFEVTLLPGGEVLDARLVRSSGVPAYDNAVERAIVGASPLPVPGESDLFQQEFRKFKFSFKPDS
jgi:colicin import membrane protein